MCGNGHRETGIGLRAQLHPAAGRSARVLLAGMVVAGVLVTTGCGAAGSAPGAATTGSGPAGTAATSSGTPGALPGTAGMSVPASPASPGGTSSTPGPGSGRPSAADQLTSFFAAAARADGQERRAAALVNEAIGPSRIVVSPALVAAVRGIDTHAVGRAVPGGLPPALLRSLLQVYADLTARQAAFNRVIEYAGESTLPRSGAPARELLDCLHNGATPARWFGTDLAAARTEATSTARVSLAPDRSRPAAEVAVRAQLIRSPNFCAAECGAFYSRPVPLQPITWKRTVLAPGSAWDGTVGTLLFTARYVTGQGWQVGLNAC